MDVPELHSWDCTPAEARALQERLAEQIELRPLPDDIRLVTGVDLAFSKPRDLVFASLVTFRLREMEQVELVELQMPCPFPYVPGLLTFREGPAVVEAFRRAEQRPDAVVFDGQGYAHPRRVGLASHMGLWLGLPTVGCAKSRLIGEHGEPGRKKGSSVPLTDNGEQIGVVLRTRTDVKPVFVSPGHLSDAATAERLVLRCCTRYRLPEPTRRADLAVSKLKKRRLGEAG